MPRWSTINIPDDPKGKNVVMKKIIDISLSVSPDLPIWPGDPPVELERVAKIEEGSEANITFMRMGAHTGTHVDAPYHFLGDDSKTLEQLSLELLTGPALVVRIPDETGLITADTLEALEIPTNASRLLFKTRNSSLWEMAEKHFDETYVAIDSGAAKLLVERGVRVVGVDYLSVAPYTDTTPTHRILLEAGVVIIEGLNLSVVEAGEFDLYCLPVKLAGADGAPARAILITR